MCHTRNMEHQVYVMVLHDALNLNPPWCERQQKYITVPAINYTPTETTEHIAELNWHKFVRANLLNHIHNSAKLLAEKFSVLTMFYFTSVATHFHFSGSALLRQHLFSLL